jgi:hypothetical protein
VSIDQKLAQARERAENYGALYGAKETADDFVKTTYAHLYQYVPEDAKTVSDKDAWIKRHPEYLKAIERKKNAYSEWKCAETYLKLLFAETEVWRSKEASARWIDKSHT